MSANMRMRDLEHFRTHDASDLELGSDSIPPPLPVRHLFEAMAKKQPHALAASFQGKRLSYAELDERSNRLARELIARGVGRGVPVAVCVRPSLECLIAILSIWKARGIYLPLDSTHPEALIVRMLDEARPCVVLTTHALSGLTHKFPQLFFDGDEPDAAGPTATVLDTVPELSDPAYLFYTSGTTGKPKGVLASQANLSQYMQSAARKYGFGSSDVFVSLARYTFSISLFELISPLCCGGSVLLLDRDEVLTPQRLRAALKSVTVLHAGPSLLGSLFRHLRSDPALLGVFPGMRHASSGGDIVPPSIMQEMKRVFPNAELYVIYGCTEVSVMGTTFFVPRESKVDRSYVGEPFPQVAVLLLDEARNPVPAGTVGEIYFGGAGVVLEYLGRPELTAERFVQIAGERYYQTGDLGRMHGGGKLEILGRSDFQVQLRGIRIELGGIESTVVELGLAEECAVLAKTMADGEQHLVAFLVKPKVRTATSFRRSLAAQLPDYMLPQHVVVLEGMPLTVNGKLDRRQLRELPWSVQLRGDTSALPINERELKIAQVFQELLGVAEVGVEDGFFDLGGDSLTGVVALEKISRAIGVLIPPRALFENGSVRALAQYDESTRGRPSAIALNTPGSGPALFALAGVHIYRELAKRLDGQCSVHAVFAEREFSAFENATGSHSVEELARDYLEIIRAAQPRGPYRLLGYSFAGIVAFEVARQLRLAGDEVRFLGLLDAALPEWVLGWKFRRAQLGRLLQVNPREVLTFALARWRRKGAAAQRADFARYQDDEQLGPLEERRDLVNDAAAAEYMLRLQPFSDNVTVIGNVTVIASGDRLRKDPLKSRSCGWAPYIPSLSIYRVETSHYKMVSHDPYVSEIARILKSELDTADAHAIGA